MESRSSKTNSEKVEASMIKLAGEAIVASVPLARSHSGDERRLYEVHEIAEGYARAAFQALSIPTPAMIEVGMRASAGILTPLQTVVVWQAMLDAALDPGENVVQGASGQVSEGGGYEDSDGRKMP